ncbi:hypothetical protein OPQ81_009813 [Rhizoctonia solani]|nr:hypothetical protein OPQ81_009813 [Rhizoctonia solani]
MQCHLTVYGYPPSLRVQAWASLLNSRSCPLPSPHASHTPSPPRTIRLGAGSINTDLTRKDSNIESPRSFVGHAIAHAVVKKASNYFTSLSSHRRGRQATQMKL